MKKGYDLDIYQMSSFSMNLAATDSCGNSLNLSGYGIYSNITPKYSNPTGVAQFSGTITSDISGIVNLYLSAAQTSGLYSSQYIYSVNAMSSGMGNVIGLLNGYINVYPSPMSYINQISGNGNGGTGVVFLDPLYY